MKEIDFTPQWYQDSLRERGGAGLRVAGLAIIAVGVLFWYVQSSRDANGAQAQLRNLQQAALAQQVLLERMDGEHRQLAAAKLRQAILEDVGGGVTAAELVAEISRLMPATLSFREVVLRKVPRFELSPVQTPAPGTLRGTEMETAPDPVSTLEISGWAASGTNIGSFVSRLSTSPLMSSVHLRYQRPEIVMGRQVVGFMVSCQMPEFQ